MRLYDFYLDDNDQICKVRHMVRAKKKKGCDPQTTVLKYGMKVPCNVNYAIELDKKNGNMSWQDAMTREDLQRKVWLVAGEHLIDILDNKVYSSMVKGISAMPTSMHLQLKSLCHGWAGVWKGECRQNCDDPEGTLWPIHLMC
eukprot:11347140-Ditylum_brightwellii.AAC.2